MFIHSVDPALVHNPQARGFYYVYLPQRRILADFYALLPDDSYDYRMVDTPHRRSDTPRESLLHILQTHSQYLDGVRRGKLDFSAKTGAPRPLKAGLLEEMDRLEQEMWSYVSGGEFDDEATVEAPWGGMRASDAIFLVRDHDILHVGWNLALMDHLNMERFPSLRGYWG